MKKILFSFLLLLSIICVGCQNNDNFDTLDIEETYVEEDETNNNDNNAVDENTLFQKGKDILLGEDDNIDEAIELFNKALEIKGDAHWIIGDLGRAKQKKGDLNGAIECYTKAIEIDNKRSVYYEWRANAYRMLGKEDLANKDQKVADKLHAKGMD